MRSGIRHCRAEAIIEGTIIEINGGKMARVEEADCPREHQLRFEIFFQYSGAQEVFEAESTELSHIASLVTHYALAHPEKHFECIPHQCHAGGASVRDIASALSGVRQGNARTVDCVRRYSHWSILACRSLHLRREAKEDTVEPMNPGQMRLHGFVSKPEIQKLNRNSSTCS